MKKFLLLGAIIVALVAGTAVFLWPPANTITFTATNVGTEPMRSLVVHITGKSYAIGDLAPGTGKSLQLHPGADSHIELALAGHPRLVIDCYFSGGYSGSIAAEVTVDQVVAINNSLIFGAY